MVESGGDRFELEGELRKTCRPCGVGQLRFGQPVTVRVVVDEINRASEHRAFQRPAQPRLGLTPEPLQVAGQHVGVGQLAARTDLGLTTDQVRTEQGLHRAHQSPVVPVHIGLQGRATEGARRAVGIVRPLRKVKNCGRHGRLVALERQQAHAAGVGQRDRGIGGAEIDGTKRRSGQGSAHGIGAEIGGAGFCPPLGRFSRAATPPERRRRHRWDAPARRPSPPHAAPASAAP